MENDDNLNGTEISGVEPLTKAQRKKLKREEKEREKEERKAERRKKLMIKRIRNWGIAVLVILVMVGFFYWRSVPPEDAPVLKLESTSYNFGRVSQAEGIASASLEMVNEGKSELVIKSMVTSCMCTSVSLMVDGKEGPRFGMHDNPKWTATLKPGEGAKLKIYYDPNMHKELKGQVTRVITIFSNDFRSPHKITIYANQVP